MTRLAKNILILSVVLSIAIVSSAKCALIVNEVLSNEPGTSKSLEWFEFFNSGSTSENLGFFVIQVGANTLTLDTSGGPIVIPAGEYLVICRNLIGDTLSLGFESFWGDSSGVWGDDTLLENYRVIEAGIDLPNLGGIVSVNGFNQSQLVWTKSGLDGTSWERLTPQLDSIVQSVSNIGSTPGRVNSLTPVPFDLALEPIVRSVNQGITNLSITIINRGSNNITGASIDLYYGTLSSNPVESLYISIDLPPIDSGFTTLLNEKLVIAEMYRPMSAQLTVDDRSSNNRQEFVAPGNGYPPALLTEFLANPTALFGSEWIELRNKEDTVIDLGGWLFGDAITLSSLSAGALLLNPGDYLVLSEDSARFLADYPGFAGELIEPLSWPILNNSGDRVRLVDRFGILADDFLYSMSHSDNITWSRDEADTTTAIWGRSSVSGGSPGQKNSVRIIQNSEALSISISPKVITPDGDGIDDEAIIIVSAPQAIAFTIKLYDRKGRIVKTFENGSSDLATEYRWDGRTDGGNRLPIGIYILYVDASGVESQKQTIVIGR